MLLDDYWRILGRGRPLSEAPGDEDEPEAADPEAGAPDYQLEPGDTGDEGADDDAGADEEEGEGGDPEADEEEEEEGEEDEAPDYQMGDDPGEDDEGSVEDDDDDAPAGGGGPRTSDDEATRLKKLVLLSQYQELSTLAGNLSASVDSMNAHGEYDLSDEYDHLKGRLAELEKKISDTVAWKFLKAPYTELLKLFFYYKAQLGALAELAEKLLKAGREQ